ncbi:MULTISPECIES: PRC-barrel domain-containing protein [unclassified Yoonia]|uniref:PRC-barrel domain-containing protein n=1 Tax=unclassified Yoonia TaxID=2629118 RepID=UPI002AFF98AF|nr:MULTISPECIES: PRC-barrel domain-containing protein [unclassified Yoonia]
MKKLMLTTALVAATSMGAFAQTEATTPAADAEMADTGANVPAFLVTNFTGKSLNTFDSEEARTLGETGATDESVRWESSETFAAGRDTWENVGNIDDVVLTQDGELRGVLVDVGGFLGIGARTVMVDLDDLYFVADETAAEDLSDFSVVATMTREELESLPEWDEAQLTTGFAATGYNDATVQPSDDAAMTPMDDTAATPADPAVAPADGTAMDTTGDDAMEGYAAIPVEELTAEQLLGANAYDAAGDNIATVDDLVLGDDGEITHAVMDVGGFLGLGSYTVALDINEVEVMWNAESDDVRVQVNATQEQLEAMPEHEG